MMQPLTKKQIDLLEDFRISGLKNLDYCKKTGCVPHVLAYVVAKEKKLRQPDPVNSNFNLVKVESINEQASSIKVMIKDTTIIVDSDFNESLFYKLIKVLRL